MKSRVGFLLGSVCVLLLSRPAHAHFKLTAPPDWLVTNDDGDPQKLSPCGTTAGTRSNMVTPVTAGSKLKVQWRETVGHPGHYRIAIAANRAQLVDPMAVVMMNDCKSAAIQNPPVAPVIADGLFPKTAGAAGRMYEHEITVPNMTCDRCTLQVLQFMSQHEPGCFYYHCADIQITAAGAADGGATPADAGPRDTAATIDLGGGAGGSGATGGAGTGGGSTGGASTGGAATGGGSPGTGGAPRGGAGGWQGGSGVGGTEPPPKTSSGGGCLTVAGGGRPATGLVLLAGAVIALALRRRRR
jgi:hypothetical protein